LIPASYAWIALSKCFDRARSGELDREEVDGTATELRRGSIFDSCRTDSLDLGFEPFLEIVAGDPFAPFLFMRKDLGVAEARLPAFLVAFDFAFAFITINAATYTNYSS
jgi:hypothetical protein